ncbi:MAG: class I SAM-dependent methyltransferase [Nocardioidaceae bacterium]
MRRHELLQGLHQVLQPRTYFEIGVRKGFSLRLSRTSSVAVDPHYEVTGELECDLHLVRTTSDEFFARKHPFAHFDEPLVDLAFIDGMHLAEFALRDFINTERYCHPGSVIVLDDMLPRMAIQAGRNRVGPAATGTWAGDVYKLIETLRTVRPDLLLLELDTLPTGTLVVLLADPADVTLAAAYDGLVRRYVVPDPQVVPEVLMSRSRAIRPEELLASPVWRQVRRARRLSPAKARQALRDAYSHAGLSTGSGSEH